MGSTRVLRSLALLALGSALQLLARPAHAAVVAADFFDYSPPGSDLLGNAGGRGFVGPWFPSGFNAFVHDNFDVESESLEYPSFFSAGGRVTTREQSTISGIGRSLLAPILATETRTLYFWFLIRPEGRLHRGIFNGFFGLYLDGSSNDLFIGKPGAQALDRYVLEARGGAGQVASNAETVVGQTALLVLRADFTPGPDRFSLAVNPQLCPTGFRPDIVKEDMDVGDVSALVLYSSGAFSLDEIRVTPELNSLPCGPRPFPFLRNVEPGAGEEPLVLFRRGDVNGTRGVDMTDAVRLLAFLFRSSTDLPCQDAADADDSGTIDVSDAVSLLSFLFLGGRSPPTPGPLECGPDLSQDVLGCEAYTADCRDGG